MDIQATTAAESAQAALAALDRDRIIDRIWHLDPSVWSDSPEEITDRLGWLNLPKDSTADLAEINRFVNDVRSAGYQTAVLMGMGGSSLAPDVFSRTFRADEGYLQLHVLDSTHPKAVRALEERIDLSRTLFLVATKSGTTTETLSFFRYFYRRVAEALGAEQAGGHFAAITDPGSPLVEIARERMFRHTFLNNPNIGGRYAALSLFGLVPAALMGVSVEQLLASAASLRLACSASRPVDRNPAAYLGVLLGTWAREGRDKLTFIMSDKIAALADWIEQLIAESTGKSGTGILPVVGEPLGSPSEYGRDRIFAHIRMEGDRTYEEPLSELEAAGHPTLTVDVSDVYAIGQQFFLWEFATAVAGHILHIHPFNQPNVESSKARAREMIRTYTQSGDLPPGNQRPLDFTALAAFLEDRTEDDYVALQAYLAPTGALTASFERLRAAIRGRTRLATTFGYGPRFLHSTGQLHKGGRNNGLFIQFVDHPREDLEIPAHADAETAQVSFGVLIQAQALGDARALQEHGRRVLTMRMETGTPDEIDRGTALLSAKQR